MLRRMIGLAISVLLVAVAAPASGANTVYRIGVLLHAGAPPGLLEAFQGRLHDLGYIQGKNITTEIRDAGGRNDRLGGLAAELVRLRVDVILALNTPAAKAAKTATGAIPIVITRVADPVKAGLVASLARPGGNVTGLSFNHVESGPKRLQLLREVLPTITRAVVLSNANNPGHTAQIPPMERAGAKVGLAIHSLRVQVPSGLPAAFGDATRVRAEALFVLDDTAITTHRGQIVQLAAAHSLPVVSRYKDFADAGGLLAYGPSLPGLYRRAAEYVDRILKGAQASDLPVEEPTEFDLVVNLKTAKALNLKIPPSVLLIATHVIE